MPGRNPAPLLITAAVAALLTLGPATSVLAQATTPPAGQVQEKEEVGKLDLETYVQAAAIGDLFAIGSAQLVAERSQEPGIRSFAVTLISDHTRLAAKLKGILAEDGRARLLPDRMDAPHMDMMQRLEQTVGSDFDRLFVQAQIAAHKEAIRVHEAYAATGEDKDLVAFAGEALDVIRHHHDILRKGVSPLDTAVRQTSFKAPAK
jgi:predicted outer membrane protein